jgi:hypothetical protein
MTEKSSGFDFDRQVFAEPEVPKARHEPPVAGVVFVLIAIAILGLLAYKFLPRIMGEPADTDDPTLADVDKHLTEIDGRLDKLEAARTAPMSAKKGEPTEGPKEPPTPPIQTVYQISPATPQSSRAAGAARTAVAATAQRPTVAQQGESAVGPGGDPARDAWQATTDKMADMAGQVETQSVEVLRNRDELNELLARTDIEAIPFELFRGSDPQPVGPISLVLKSANPKRQSYTLCAYIQGSCTELKDRTLYEVVQFVVSRNSIPLRVVATKLTRDEIVGYLEIPRERIGH